MDNLITSASRFGHQEDVFDGFDFTINARLPSRALVTGGLSLGRERINTCYMLDDRSLAFTPNAPRTTPFCDIRPPMQPNLKVQAVYPLPWWAIQVAATVQSLPGAQIWRSAEHEQPSDSRVARPQPRRVRRQRFRAGPRSRWMYFHRARCTATVSTRSTSASARLVRIGRTAIRPTVSVYNLLNANPVLQIDNRYGATWPVPTVVLTARFVDFGVQVDF